MKGKKLFIGITNSQDRVPSSFFWSFIQMVHPCPLVVVRAPQTWSPIRHNFLFKTFLESDFDYFVEMDVDQVYPQDYLIKMVPLIDEYKAIAPLIYDRQIFNDFFPLVFKDADIGNFTLTTRNIQNESGIIEVKYCHANIFMAREVMEKIKWPPYEGGLNNDGLQKAKHADFLLNDKIREAGYKLYCNLDVCVEHIVELPMNTETYTRWKRGKENEGIL